MEKRYASRSPIAAFIDISARGGLYQAEIGHGSSGGLDVVHPLKNPVYYIPARYRVSSFVTFGSCSSIKSI